jgi:hypothetical protein
MTHERASSAAFFTYTPFPLIDWRPSTRFELDTEYSRITLFLSANRRFGTIDSCILDKAWDGWVLSRTADSI